MALATEAAWCAHDQGKFFEYQHALYENQGQITYDQASLTDLALETALDVADFSQCLSSGQHRDDVEEARQAAANRGINSTPTFYINNQRVTGNQPYDVFAKIIEQELALAQ
jgi:protein-disulfide isomerase